MKKELVSKEFKEDLKRKMKVFYPFFFIFYILSLFIAIFSKVWRTFFYWPGMHGSMILFTLFFALTFLSEHPLQKFRIWVSHFCHASLQTTRQPMRLCKKLISFLTKTFIVFFRRHWLKLLVMVIILIFSLVHNIDPLLFLILAYALISILFGLDSRWSAGAALIFLAVCPLLLIIKKETIAESSAVYAYYFLVITVLTQIREMMKKKQEIAVDK